MENVGQGDAAVQRCSGAKRKTEESACICGKRQYPNLVCSVAYLWFRAFSESGMKGCLRFFWCFLFCGGVYAACGCGVWGAFE
jgi:hypothetical protein